MSREPLVTATTDGTAFGTVDDEVGAHRPEQNPTVGEVLAPVAHARRFPKGLKCIEQLSDPPIGGVDVIRRDIFPNLVEHRSECSRSRSRLPALLGFALQSGTRDGRVNHFAAVEGGKTAPKFPVEVGQLGGASGVVLLQKPQGLTDDFAC